ncbi:hypothetical protein DV515_00001750 [Chloebia gouldiae]|uniref:Uncharacterized protein n=1 Tax=Chloebia gouldiae TaxID=44316 RepID=A0A3L8SZU9_CHLGU|nr:hypothetical protein DV515_00001750 [Chloebia gouldiae]
MRCSDGTCLAASSWTASGADPVASEVALVTRRVAAAARWHHRPDAPPASGIIRGKPWLCAVVGLVEMDGEFYVAVASDPDLFRMAASKCYWSSSVRLPGGHAELVLLPEKRQECKRRGKKREGIGMGRLAADRPFGGDAIIR